ncbi:hypothetical protein [Comamonas aquatica]|uniref:hypothetical protein n=1 Tax=Comamonas aquatica TaxID=225991 RepID=UPI00244CC16D|nr:hypothetical protein [Comamonas aquatica]MDH0199838.1 hypothetical protein [Comamonas aquatica]MDH1444882.1 hypothetical protein [Comamonas aquatica]
MANTERMAAAAHLHVALRRKAGRVTDTDWMARNDEYAREIVRVARARAAEDGDAALAGLADRLAALLDAGATAPAPAAVPLVERVAHRLRDAAPPGDEAGRYIGGLR